MLALTEARFDCRRDCLKAGSNSTQVVTWGIPVNIPIPARVGWSLLSYLEASLYLCLLPRCKVSVCAMPYVIKTDPFNASPGDAVTIAEKPMYGGSEIRPGDEAFIWFSETRGGNGLAWQAHVVALIGRTEGRDIAVTLCLTNRGPADALSKEDLEPLREVRDGAPLSEIARKLYYQAHNKIAALSHNQADFLRRFFDPDSDLLVLRQRVT